MKYEFTKYKVLQQKCDKILQNRTSQLAFSKNCTEYQLTPQKMDQNQVNKQEIINIFFLN